MEPLQPGDPGMIGTYRLEGRLGAGGMGEVFLGRSAGGRRVAVKLIRPEYARDAQFRARFAREVAAARRVGGFHSAQVVDADPGADPPWLVTAFVDGPSLRDLVVERGPLDARGVRRLGAELAEGLAAIHACGLVHRDLKPGNIVMAVDGPRIIDFGIARDLGASSITSSGVVLGTYSFMSPEQVRADRAGPASDVFALGCVLVYAATGRGPFDAATIPAIVHRIVREPPYLDGVPGDLHGVLAACLAKDPKRRPPLDVVLKEFARTDFTAASSPPVGGMPATRPAGPIPVPVPPARVGRRALLIGTSVVAGTAALGGMAALHWAGGSGTPGGPHAVAAMAFTQDGKTLVVLGGDGLNTLWRCPVDGGAAQTVRLDTPADGSAVVFSADAKTLVRAEGVTIKLWDTATGHVTSTLKGPNDGFTVSALSPDGTRLAAAAQSHGLQFWDVTAGSVTTTLPAGSDMIGALAFDPESLHVAVGSMDGNTVRIIDARSAQVQATLSEGNSIGSVAFSPDGSTLAIGGNGTRLWDMSANSRSVSLADPTGHDVVVAFAPGGGRLASGSDQGGVTIWDMGARKAVTVLRSARPPMAYGSVLAAVANGKVTLWNVATGRIIRTF